MSLASERVTFDDLCAVMPPLDDRDRVAAFRAFADLTPVARRNAVAAAQNFRQARTAAGLRPASCRNYISTPSWWSLR